MNKFDELLKLIIPAIFLIVWALSQLFNREGQPARQRSRPMPREGGGAGGLPRRPMPGDRDPSTRWPELEEPSLSTPVQEERRRRNDEIVILGTETRAPRTPPHRPATRGSSRSRSAATRRTGRDPAPTRPEPPAGPTKNLTTLGSLTTSLQPVDLSFETRTMGILSPAAQPMIPPATTVTRTEGLRNALRTPERIREALVLNELLGPPVGLRGARRRRR